MYYAIARVMKVPRARQKSGAQREGVRARQFYGKTRRFTATLRTCVVTT
jgi:hypothetical protein